LSTWPRTLRRRLHLDPHRRAPQAHGEGDELGDAHVVELQAGVAGVEAGDLEQVLDHGVEPLDVGDEQVEGGLGPLRHLVPPPCSTSTEAARVVSGDRSSWLTSDANRASRSMRSCSASPCR
jgi:hypothetical protein